MKKLYAGQSQRERREIMEFAHFLKFADTRAYKAFHYNLKSEPKEFHKIKIFCLRRWRLLAQWNVQYNYSHTHIQPHN